MEEYGSTIKEHLDKVAFKHGDKFPWMHIKMLTSNYTWPEAACNTFRVSMLELKEFEENLHQHVHLENNILFPGALAF